LAAKVEEAVEAQIKSLDLSTPTKDWMNEIEEAVLETVSEKYLTPKASDTGLPIGILHHNRKRGHHHQSSYGMYHCWISCL
jgi:hypothetical protein